MNEIRRILEVRPYLLRDEEVAEILDLLPALERWIRDLKGFALSSAMDNGVFYEGFKVKVFTRRRIGDEMTVVEKLYQYDTDLFSKCVRPIKLTELERALGEHLFEMLVEPHIVKDKSYRLVRNTPQPPQVGQAPPEPEQTQF